MPGLNVTTFWYENHAQDASKTPPDDPKRPTRRPQKLRRGPQDAPKTLPRRPKTSPRRLQDASRTAPKRLQDGSKTVLHPKTVPRRPQDAPKTPQDAAKRSRRRPRTLRRSPPETKRDPKSLLFIYHYHNKRSQKPLRFAEVREIIILIEQLLRTQKPPLYVKTPVPPDIRVSETCCRDHA